MIEVCDLVKKYGSHTAVDHLSFEVPSGKVVGLLGKNGAGKSTTLNMITGYLAPTQGKVCIQGIDMARHPAKAKKCIGYLPEVPALYPDMTVEEYLRFVAELKGIPMKLRREEVQRVLQKTDTVEMTRRLIRHLSKGYCQRVGLAAAMLGNPEMLILDEPSVGLDPVQIQQMRELIRELGKEHTILLSSHIMQEIQAVCDEILIIDQGKLIVRDTPEELVKRQTGNALRMEILGEPQQILDALAEVEGVLSAEPQEEEMMYEVQMAAGEDIRARIFYAMAGISCPIVMMQQEEASLEEAFLAVTASAGEEHEEKEEEHGSDL